MSQRDWEAVMQNPVNSKEMKQNFEKNEPICDELKITKIMFYLEKPSFYQVLFQYFKGQARTRWTLVTIW